jgi:hypothetical protein
MFTKSSCTTNSLSHSRSKLKGISDEDIIQGDISDTIQSLGGPMTRAHARHMLGTSMSRYLNCDQVIEGHVPDSRQKVKICVYHPKT